MRRHIRRRAPLRPRPAEERSREEQNATDPGRSRAEGLEHTGGPSFVDGQHDHRRRDLERRHRDDQRQDVVAEHAQVGEGAPLVARDDQLEPCVVQEQGAPLRDVFPGAVLLGSRSAAEVEVHQQGEHQQHKYVTMLNIAGSVHELTNTLCAPKMDRKELGGALRAGSSVTDRLLPFNRVPLLYRARPSWKDGHDAPSEAV